MTTAESVTLRPATAVWVRGGVTTTGAARTISSAEAVLVPATFVAVTV